ncbi:MAG: hypothetical protein NVSMB25_07240 [Thermoleophilaceae bacterium]
MSATALRACLIFALALGAGVLGACGGAPSLAAGGQSSRPAGAGSWPTYHATDSRAGAMPDGPSLGRVRRLWSSPVDGSVYAEPLAVGRLVVAATENNSIYAFDASTGRLAWRTHLGEPVPGGTLPCGNIDPSGITGTPSVDIRAGVVYAVAFEQPAHHVLVGLDLASGRIRTSRAIDAPGADPRVEQERGALAISHGRVYVPFGGLYGDCGNYHGWVVASRLGGEGALDAYRVPSRREGGLWAASGPAVDSAGNVFVASGNGSASHFDFGNAVIRLTPSLRQADFFAPRDAARLNGSDTDLGSIGPLLLPAHRAFVIGKDGLGYLLNARRLGGIGGQRSVKPLCGGGAYGGLAFARGTVFVPCTSGIVSAALRGSTIHPGWRAKHFRPGPPIVAGAAVWTIDLETGELYALDRRDGRVRFHASIGDAMQFSSPSAGGGRIYVAGGLRVHAFGG